MNALTLNCLLLTLALLPWQRPATSSQSPEDKPAWPWGTPAEGEQMAKDVQGAWQITSVESDFSEFGGGDIAGYMIFANGYMSMEVHGQGIAGSRQENPGGWFYYTGTYRFRFTELNQMELDAMIGLTSLTFDEQVSFLPVGTRRLFDVTVTDDLLTLERRDVIRYQMTRLREPISDFESGVNFDDRYLEDGSGLEDKSKEPRGRRR